MSARALLDVAGLQSRPLRRPDVEPLLELGVQRAILGRRLIQSPRQDRSQLRSSRRASVIRVNGNASYPAAAA